MRDDYVSRTFTSALKGSVYPAAMRGPSPPRDVYGGTHRDKGYTSMFTPDVHGISTGTVLMISNLSGTVSRTDIIDLCEVCGPIESAQLLGRGVAEVVFLSKDDAQEAYRRYHKRNLDGMPMVCKLVTDTRATGLAMADPTLARYSELTEYDHAQNWLY
jgi:RNA recognition motif-containing protein